MRTNVSRLIWLLPLASLILVLGCSGSVVPKVERPTAVASEASYPSATDVIVQEGSLIAEINRYRQSQGLEPLVENATLAKIARWEVEDMTSNDYFGHVDSLGRDVFARMCDLGFCDNVWKGENLAAGPQVSLGALDLLKNSPGHNANLLNPNFQQVGVALDCQLGAYYGCYWAIEFAGTNSKDSSSTGSE